MKVKILNLQNAPKLQVVKVIKELTNQGLKETKDQVDAVVASGKDSMEFETLCHKQHIKQAFDDCGLNYCFSDECPQHEKAGLFQDITDFTEQIEKTGDYVVPTENGLQLVMITHLPANQELVSRIMGALQDGCCNVFERNITSEKGNPGIRLQIVKEFPQGAKDLHDVTDIAMIIHDIIINMLVIIDIEQATTAINKKLDEAVKQLSW